MDGENTMSVTTELNQDEFIDLFIAHDRDYFSIEGYTYLYNICDEFNLSPDPVGLCSKYTEYGDDVEIDFKDFQSELHYLDENAKDIEELMASVVDKGIGTMLSNGNIMVDNDLR